MSDFQDFSSQGFLVGFDDEISVLININSKYEIIIETYNLDSEIIKKIDNNEIEILKIKTKDYSISIYEIYIYSQSYSMSGNRVTLINGKYALIGQSFLLDIGKGFKTACIELTDSKELIGIYPYILDSHKGFNNFNKSLLISYNNESYTVNTPNYYIRFYSIPYYDFCNKTDLKEYKGRIEIEFKCNQNINQINEYINEIIHFFNLLSGETITCINFTVDDDPNCYEVIGYVNYPKFVLKKIEDNGFDKKGYLRRTLPKISDFKENIDDIYNKWITFHNAAPVTIEIYNELIFENEFNIFTINSFLRIPQIIQGYERFIHKKNNMSLRECLINFTNKVFDIFKSYGINKNNSIDELIKYIVKERNLYTHDYINEHIDKNKLHSITKLYTYLIRLVILEYIGANPYLINNRFLLIRDYKYYMKKLLNVEISNNNIVLSMYDNLAP